RCFRIQTGLAEPSVYAIYLYDSNGRRVKKLARKQGGSIRVVTYIDGSFECTFDGTGENNTILLETTPGTTERLRIGKSLKHEGGPARCIHFSCLNGSISLTVADDGQWINREEYSPFGETLFGGYVAKRFRFVGLERDKESGLYAAEARM